MRRGFLIFPAISSGSKIQCVVVCNFNSWCAFIFYKPIKKFEFLGASRAPRFCVNRERGSGDENALYVTRSLHSSFLKEPQRRSQIRCIKSYMAQFGLHLNRMVLIGL